MFQSQFSFDDVVVIAIAVAIGKYLFECLDQLGEMAYSWSRPLRRRFGLWLFARPVFDRLLARLESEYPILAEPGELEDAWFDGVSVRTYDPNPRRRQRWDAVIRGDERYVSFWRKRRAAMEERWLDEADLAAEARREPENPPVVTEEEAVAYCGYVPTDESDLAKAVRRSKAQNLAEIAATAAKRYGAIPPIS